MRFTSVFKFHQLLRKIPALIAFIVLAIVASSLNASGLNHGTVLAGMMVVSTSKRSPLARKLLAKSTRKLLSKSRKKKAGAAENEMFDLDISKISLTINTYPVNDERVLVKSGYGGKRSIELHVDVEKAETKKGILYGIVYQPNKPDLENDWARPETIEKAAHRFLEKARNGQIDIDHNQQVGAGTIVESFIINGTDDRFPTAKSGAWCVAIQLSEELKKSADTIKGLSMWGTAKSKSMDDPNAPAEEADPDGDGKSLQILRAAAGVGDVQMAQALGLEHQEYLDFENGDADYDWTPESIKAAAKLLKMPVEDFSSKLLNGDDPEETQTGEQGNTDPAEPAPTGPTGKSVPKSTTKNMPAQRKVLKATVPEPIKVGDPGANIIPVKKSIEDRYRTIGKAFLYATKALILKEGLLPEEYFESKDQLISKGLFAPGDFDPAGTIQPALAREVFDVTVDRSGFLKRIQTVMMNSISQNVAVADVGERTMTRLIPAGSPGATVAAGNQAKTVNLAKKLYAYEVDLPFFVQFNLIYNYQGNLPALEQKIGEIIMLSNANQFVDLGLNGTTNTFDGSSFLTLSEGWFALAKRVITAGTDGANASQSFSIAAVGGLTTPLKVMDELIKRMAQYQRRYANKANVIIMGTEDFESLEVTRIARPNSEQVLTDGAAYRYRGHEIIVVDYLDAGNWMYTPIQNFIFGMVTQGQGGTRLQSLEVIKGIQHNLESAVDFEFVNYQPIIVAAP